MPTESEIVMMTKDGAENYFKVHVYVEKEET